ncbi:hypothetical protein LOTGIDRAFT_171635 [Lottia gigantea]|uniref:Uncharacterized protein n=1 Tax=Lottia gigantea TaxID=225164 RepID=V4B6L9_LOTGI|nr:hypothetical protein LOTGIDRAFT_171635 [Lottia gigantea]ESP03166.1 hypothetical protein LOTGIDRAFT_171635 [Lottia gigantea]
MSPKRLSVFRFMAFATLRYATLRKRLPPVNSASDAFFRLLPHIVNILLALLKTDVRELIYAANNAESIRPHSPKRISFSRLIRLICPYSSCPTSTYGLDRVLDMNVILFE